MKADVERTEKYYSTIGQEALCNCNYCKNYYMQIKAEYQEVAAYLALYGIDIEKPSELLPLEPDGEGMLEYCACQYIVFGTCPEHYYHKIGDVEFGAAVSHPSTGIEEVHFVLEFGPVRLKMVLPL